MQRANPIASLTMLVFKKRRKIREMATITFVCDEIVVKKFS